MGDAQVHALRGVDFTVKHGKFIAMMGAPWLGKSTLLRLLESRKHPTRIKRLFIGEQHLYATFIFTAYRCIVVRMAVIL